MMEVSFTYQFCGHQNKEHCHEKESDVPCKSRCSKMMACDLHKCNETCSTYHSHHFCKVETKFEFPACGHDGVRECSSIERNEQIRQKCRKKVSYPCLKCKSDRTFGCYEVQRFKADEVSFPCPKCKSERKFDCYVVQRFEEDEDKPPRCENVVKFDYSSCEHSNKKKCYQKESDVPCEVTLYSTEKECGHKIGKKCHQNINDISCPEACERHRFCGHLCEKKFGEICGDSGDCKPCEIAHEEFMKNYRAEGQKN